MNKTIRIFSQPRFSLLILLLLALFVWSISLYLHPDFFNNQDAAIYADIGRHIISGKGITTNYVNPMFLRLLPSGLDNWPPFYPPLQPLMIGLSFLLFGISDLPAVLVSGFFYLATLVPLFLLSKKLYNLKVAWLASTWYIFTPSLLGYSQAATSESLFTFLITLSLYLLFVPENCFFWTGFIIGLAYLTKFQGLLLIFPISYYLFKKKNKVGLALFLAGLLVIILVRRLLLPPMAQDYAGFARHELWTIVAAGGLIDKTNFPRALTMIEAKTVLANLDQILIKILANFYYFWQSFFTLTLPPLTIFYALSFSKKSSHQKTQGFKFLSLLLIVFFIFFHLTTLFDKRFLHPLLPALIIVAAATLFSVIKNFMPKKPFVSSALFTCLFIILPTFTSPGWGTSIQRSLAQPKKPTVLYLLAKIVKDNTLPKAVIVTDQAAHIAWYANRKSIELPLSIGDLKKIDEMISLDGLFISNCYPEHYPEWQDLVEKPHAFGDFYVAKSFEIKPEENYYRIPIKAVLYLKNQTPSLPK